MYIGFGPTPLIVPTSESVPGLIKFTTPLELLVGTQSLLLTGSNAMAVSVPRLLIVERVGVGLSGSWTTVIALVPRLTTYNVGSAATGKPTTVAVASAAYQIMSAR